MSETIISLLLEKVAGFAQDEILKAATAKAEVEKLETRLKAIQPFLRAAYNEQFSSKDVKDWVWRLNEVIYDALDVIDLYRIKSKVHKGLNSVARFPKTIRLLRKTGTKIMKINERLKMMDEEKNQYGLKPMLEESSTLVYSLGVLKEERETISAITDMKIIGREEDEEVVLKWLFEESNPHEDSASVIAIVAMGGVGKTALAKKLYHNSRVQDYFDKCMWVCVAETSKLSDLFGKILEVVEEKGSCSTQLPTVAEALRSKITDHLKNKRFLLVLDDVWDNAWWKEMKGLLQDCTSGSKVLITTRQMEVAKAIGLAHLHELKCLNEEQSWELFLSKTLRRGEDERDLDGVKDVGKAIVQKCGGLPLALNAVGGLLQQKQRRKPDWQDVLRSPLWNWKGPQNNNKVFAAIALSYMTIPFQLKQCLTYCCMYPKDFVMKKTDLVRLWVAEGFISTEEGMEMEVTAESCLHTLVGCSLIQDAGNGRYTLHDLVHDFALYMREKEYVSTDQLNSKKVFHHARYVSSVGGGCSSETLRGQEKLRGLMCHEVDCVPTFNFVAFRWLRVLDLRWGKFSKLPESIGDLMLLKYINLLGARIFELPESIIRLRELQTLILSHSEVKRLPNKISELGSLRHLDIDETELLEYLPSEIGMMTCLQTLSKFVVGSGRTLDESMGSSLSELRELNYLRGNLRIEHLERVGSLEEADHAELKRKESLHGLHLSCDMSYDIEFNKTVIEKVEQVYERMEPPTAIESISIKYYPGTKCPTWISSSTYSCLRNIEVWDCKFLENLPNLGFLPNLVDLLIYSVKMIKVFDTTCDHMCGKVAFPKLEKLRLWTMKNLEEWKFDSKVENMPCLEELDIQGCPNLRAIPFFSTLKKLTIEYMAGWGGWPMAKERDMPCLKKMSISSSEKLKLLPRLSSGLVKTTIISCPSVTLTSMPELKKVRHLDVISCPNLEYSLLQGLQDGKLESLVIEDCLNLCSIPVITGLKRLHLRNLPRLQSLCMTFASTMGLKFLSLRNLPQLQSLPSTFLDSLRGLEELDLRHMLGSVDVEELLARLGMERLRRLRVSGFHDLGVEWLESRISDLLQLKQLDIEDCPRLLMSVINVLKQHPLPNLEFLRLASLVSDGPIRPTYVNMKCELVIDSVETSNKLAGLMEKLSSKVRGLDIKVLAGVDSLPEWIQQLHQLQYLRVHESPHLTRLPHWLNKLSQLEWLELDNLPELVEVPAVAFKCLEGLQSLHIYSCPKLSSLPDELSSLPRLRHLNIFGALWLSGGERKAKARTSSPASVTSFLKKIKYENCRYLK
ncbi:disease resistance protein RGA2-like [Nymphaea colorata]|nr:disease resistance protein RGA2-like [Nymphaea colorata]